MRSLLSRVWRKPPVLDEAGRWSVRVALLAIDEDFQTIVNDVANVATDDGRRRVREFGQPLLPPNA